MPYCYEYPRPMLTVDAVVFAGSGAERLVALIRRKGEPFAGCWALPGGFVEMEETLEQAVARELEEETGLRGVPLKQLGAFGDPGRDPRGRSVTVAYLGTLPEALPLRAADDAAAAEWFPTAAMPSLAFDHGMIVAYAAAQR